MPKLKTKKGVAKRFKVTKTGKVKMSKSNRRHILTSKVKKRKRQLRKGEYLKHADEARIRVLLHN
ncbi:MAG: 50S ribosomal protein L35 [bacterium]